MGRGFCDLKFFFGRGFGKFGAPETNESGCKEHTKRAWTPTDRKSAQNNCAPTSLEPSRYFADLRNSFLSSAESKSSGS